LFGSLLAIGALYFNPIASIVIFVVTLMRWITQNGDDALRAGAVGEDETISVLSQLPDSYTIYNQVDLPNEKSRTGFNEADIIVSGPNVIFVIEVKHNNGAITGDVDAKEWHVRKVGRGGTPYSKTMRNPIAQVKKLVWLLSSDLKQRKQRAWVQGIVVFSNDDATLSVTSNNKIPVLELSKLNQYIATFDASSKMSNPRAIERRLCELKAA